jgi:hypothetical protein
MLCAVCNKESKNQRVCPYCFTPYPAEQPSAKRPTRSSPAPGAGAAVGGGSASDSLGALREKAQEAWAFYLRQTPIVRYTSAAIVAVLLLMWLTSSGSQYEAGVVQSEIIATPLERDEALATIRSTRETALVDIQQDEVFVTYSAATFPVREEGQLALVQLFTRADEIVEGRKRRIYFYNPNGKMFAQADGVRGVVLVR